MSKFQDVIDFVRGKTKRNQPDNNKNNNRIINKPKNVEIVIWGSNNTVKFIGEREFFGGTIIIGSRDCQSNNVLIEIGENTNCHNCNILAFENNSKIIIGKDCLLSDSVFIWNSDTHSVLDKNGNLINYGNSIEIGNHVWIGLNVKIGKNTKIANNSIVGWNSVVTKQFTEENVMIAGNPAKIKKREINWSIERPNQYKERSING